MYKKRQMKSIPILLILLATSSCTSISTPSEVEPVDTVVIEYKDSIDTLIILDTVSVVKKNAKNLWTPKCIAYRRWRIS